MKELLSRRDSQEQEKIQQAVYEITPKALYSRTSPFGPQTHRNRWEERESALLKGTAEGFAHAVTRERRRGTELRRSPKHNTQIKTCRHKITCSQP